MDVMTDREAREAWYNKAKELEVMNDHLMALLVAAKPPTVYRNGNFIEDPDWIAAKSAIAKARGNEGGE